MQKITNIKKIIRHQIAINVYWWLLFFLAIFIPVMIFNDAGFAFLISFTVVFPCILPVYINFYLLDKYLKKKMYLKYVIWFFVLVTISGALAQYLVYLLVPMGEGDVFGTFGDPIILIIITTGARYYWQGIKLQMQVHEAQAKQYKAELDLLKFQVNPHFFFNTLNNLFSMARGQKDQSTAKGIAKLSHLMRYIIYDCNVDKIDIDKEIEQINNFIELQKLRFSEDDDIKIDFRINEEIQNNKITPMLLIPFVENAFKHGISLKSKSLIDIELSIVRSELVFSVKNTVNKIKQKWKDQTSGIGLKNVGRRLELLYPDSHNLNIKNNGEMFEILLSIQL